MPTITLEDGQQLLMTTGQLARLLGVQVQTIKRAIADGMPVAKRGGNGRGDTNLFDMSAVTWWCTRVVSSTESERRRLFKEQADRISMQNAAFRDTHVPTAHVRLQAEAMFGLWTSGVAAAADRVADRLGLPEDARGALIEELNAANRELTPDDLLPAVDSDSSAAVAQQDASEPEGDV